MNNKLYMVIKRLVDIILSAILIILLFPLFIAVYLIITILDDGSAIFKQERLGKDSKPFMMLKFRSMAKSAPNIAARDINNHDYTTKVGRIIRKTSIDEIPQLFNILKGEMSFVGPRPFIPHEGIIIELRKKHHVDRLRPGLTGYAQVEARETIDQEHKFNLDLYYFNHVSMGLDIKIFYKTLFALKGK